MGPFKLKSVKKQMKKLDLREKDHNFTLKPFIEKWIKEHPPKMSFNARSKDISFNDWKSQIVNLMSEKIPIIEPVPFSEEDLKIHGEAETDDIKFIKFSITTLPGLRIPAIISIPKNLSSKSPAVICIHGHGISMASTIGLKKSKNKEYFGYELAKEGYITISPDWIGSGEREKFWNRFLLVFQNESERSNWVRFLGLDMMGLRVSEIKAIINYIEIREDIDLTRIGVIGHSGGGMLSLFSAFFDKRIKVCCTSGYFGTWEHSVLAMYHCGCNYSADLAKYIEMYDIYAALAPLPLAACAGKDDGIFPIQGTNIAGPIITRAYEESGHPENLLIDVQPGGHRFYNEKIYPFIKNKL